MNLQDIVAVFAICTPLIGGAGAGGKYWADHTYLTISGQNLQLQWSVEDELNQINTRIERGTATNDDLIRKAVLEERKRHLAK